MRNHILKVSFLLLGDFLLLYGALFAALFLRYAPLDEDDWDFISSHIIPFGAVFGVWIVIFGAFGLYDLRLMRNNKRFFYRLMNAAGMATILAVLILYFTINFFGIEPRRNLILIAFFAVLILSGWRFLFNYFIVKTPGWRVLFIGVNKEAASLIEYLLKNPQLGQKPVATLTINGAGTNFHLPLPRTQPAEKIPHFSDGSEIEKAVRNYCVDTIVITQDIKENKTLVDMLFRVVPLGVGVVEFTKFYEMFTGKIPLSLITEVWFLENLVGIKKQMYEFFKRLADVILILIAAVPALILFPFIAVAIKLDSEGPIFYRQRRIGRHGKEFQIIKYRTMVKDADKLDGRKGDGPDPRHTKVGLFLRKSYLDELPQIINILRGEMSFVGPRPERPEYVKKLKQKISFYEMRLLVPPGITGWAQINMENDASVEDAPEKMQYDLYYIKNRSFVLDFLIILRTIFIIFRRQGR